MAVPSQLGDIKIVSPVSFFVIIIIIIKLIQRRYQYCYFHQCFCAKYIDTYLQKVPVGEAVIRVRVRVRFIQFKVPVLAPSSTFGGDILSWGPLVIFYTHLG